MPDVEYECVCDLHSGTVPLGSSHNTGVAEEFRLRSEAHADSKRLSRMLYHRRPRIRHRIPHESHWEVKGQHQGLESLKWLFRL